MFWFSLDPLGPPTEKKGVGLAGMDEAGDGHGLGKE